MGLSGLEMLIALVFGYLCGTIPFGLILTKSAGLGDIRSIGSGNIGATNVLRTGNKKIAALTLVLDALKGTVPALLMGWLYGPQAAVLAGLAAFVGHLFPMWLGFKGGKGVATTIGVLFGLYWPLGLIFIAVWIAMAVVFRMSSLSALTASLFSPVAAYLVGQNSLVVPAAIMGAAVFITHRANIARIMKGEEPRIGEIEDRMSQAVLSDTERRDWLRLSMSENVGPATFRSLMARYGNAGDALQAIPELTREGGLPRSPRLYGTEAAQRDLDRAEAIGARFVAMSEPDYPPLLRMADGAPPLICIKGDASLLTKSAVGIVGARNASAVGRKFARQMAMEIGGSGHVIVSGLARGIDTAAHEASLETGTIAVLAGGLDVVYPPENDALQAGIGERGVLVTEMTPGTVPRAEHFPRRNRIISGIARALIVVEAALRSGSLITARYANEQGREVFAVPGSPLDPRCEGCNRLIRDGATLLMSSADVVETLSANFSPRQMQFFEPEQPAIEPRDISDDDRDRILELLSPNPVDTDDLIRESGLPTGAVTALILELSLAGRVIRYPNGAVSLA